MSPYKLALLSILSLCSYTVAAAAANNTWWQPIMKYSMAAGTGALLNNIKQNDILTRLEIKHNAKEYRWRAQIAGLERQLESMKKSERSYSALEKEMTFHINNNMVLQANYDQLQKRYENLKAKKNVVPLAVEHQLRAAHQSNCRLRSLINYWQARAQELEEDRDKEWVNNIILSNRHLMSKNELLSRELITSETTNNNLRRQNYLLNHLRTISPPVPVRAIKWY